MISQFHREAKGKTLIHEMRIRNGETTTDTEDIKELHEFDVCKILKKKPRNIEEMNLKTFIACIYQRGKLLLFKSQYFIEKHPKAIAWIL